MTTAQQKLIGQLDRDYPKENRYQGRTDTKSLMSRFLQFRNACVIAGITNQYLHMALPVMMTSGRIRDYCTDQALRLGNWNEVLQAMQDRYEDGDLRRERENRWLLRGVAGFVEEKGSGLTLAEQAMGFFYEMEYTQSSLSQSNQTTRVLLDKLKLSYKNYPLMIQAVSRFLNMHMSPLQLATAVRDELVTAAMGTCACLKSETPPESSADSSYTTA